MGGINETLVASYLETLVAFGPRVTGTTSCDAAAKYIFHEFFQMGLDVRYQNWSHWEPGVSPRVLIGSNVIGIHPGYNHSSNHIIIFNAHYDTVKTTPGADDDGSGVAAVLAAAQILSQFQFEHTIKFIAFSGEEDGLLGSGAYARQAYEMNDTILVALNADMIGHTTTAEGGNTLRIYGSEDVSWILDDIEDMNMDHGFNYVFKRGTLQAGGGGGSDYYSFLQYGFDAIAFFEYEWNTNMHTPQDDLTNVNISYLTKNTRLITGLLATLGETTPEKPQGGIQFPRRGRIYRDEKVINTLPTEKTIVLDDISIKVNTPPSSYPVTHVEFYYDGNLESTDQSPPFQWRMDKISLGNHEIQVAIYDDNGGVSHDWMQIFYINLLRSRSFHELI